VAPGKQKMQPNIGPIVKYLQVFGPNLFKQPTFSPGPVGDCTSATLASPPLGLLLHIMRYVKMCENHLHILHTSCRIWYQFIFYIFIWHKQSILFSAQYVYYDKRKIEIWFFLNKQPPISDYWLMVIFFFFLFFYY